MAGSVIERRKPIVVEQEKFATQRTLTYCLLLIFALVVAEVMWRNIDTERSTVLQTVINLIMLAVGFWLGASKQGQDTAQSMQRIAENAPKVAADVVANASAPSGDIKTAQVNVEADSATVTVPKA